MLNKHGNRKDRRENKTEIWEMERDLVAGGEALQATRGSSFWDWDKGSFPHYWRWQSEIQKDLRDGTKLWVDGKLPQNKTFKQRKPKEKHVAVQMIEKLGKVRERGYIAPG